MTTKISSAAPPAPPKMPTSADKQLLDFALSAELSVHDLYVKAIDSGMLSADEKVLMEMFSEHHKSYAQSLNGLLGKAATNTRNEALYSTYAGQLVSAQAMNRVLQSVENTMVATHTDILSSLQGLDGATLVASIITVEARHAAVFGTLPSPSLTDALNSAASSLAPNAAPAAATTETTVAP
ncbi:unannotated protein [freshwater metagenome]|uniref:Unannotated protein n=1 Tax=freshwater metagenome TaxID=449393 RepID=A0A6J7G840_9ZZZZ|nr:hypothetical protein [Actinomycetota bacterium]MSW48930.1 hypothetical protein [Actinomycetota bacterium]